MDDTTDAGGVRELIISRDCCRDHCYDGKTEREPFARPKVRERHDDLLSSPKAKPSTPPCMCTL